MEHIEYEERVMISKGDYNKVIDHIKKEKLSYKESFILNVYLDNASGFIYKNKMMIRIRTTNGKDTELTLKIKNKDGSNREINETLNKHPLIDKELEGNFNEYHEVAKLITERIEIEKEDYLFVLDKNIYHGKIDYDIEIEANSQQKAYEILKMYCDKYNLKYKENYKTKSHRAITQAMRNKK